MSKSVDDRIADLWSDYGPRIEGAKKEDGAKRHLHFLDIYEERIGDFPAVPLTLEKWIILSEVQALGSTTDPSIQSVLSFLWIVSPSFRESRWRAKVFFFLNRKKVDVETIVEDIHDYLSNAFKYIPGKKSKNNSAGGEWISTVVDTFANEYGWSVSEILRLPIPQLFLLLSRIRSRHSEKSPEFHSESDFLRDEFMRKANLIRKGAI